MIFWLLAALLTLAAALAVMAPFFRSGDSVARREAHDIEVYRDQLEELEREVRRGLVGREEAGEARAEIGRRILRAEDALKSGERRRPGGRSARMAAVAAVLAVPIVSWGFYGLIGSPGVPAEPLQARLAKDPEQSSIDELVARAESHLADNPDDGRGWQVLAPVYFRMGRYGDARTAYENAIRTLGATAGRQADLGEAIAGEAGGIVTAEAEDAFQRALTRNKDNPKARFFLAIARAQEGRMDEARAMWTALRDSLPDNSPWRGAIREAMGQAGEATPDGNAPAPAAPGPSQADVAAASDMTPDDRVAMVEGMVSRLDRKLRENPDDPDGWRRLVRSYTVLEREDAASDALRRGMDALGAGTENGKELKAFARELGVSVTE